MGWGRFFFRLRTIPVVRGYLMAYGITREELILWKQRVEAGNIALITHKWLHPRHPEYRTVTKAGCADRRRLEDWGYRYGLRPEWIHGRGLHQHFDLLGTKQLEILQAEGLEEQIERFGLRISNVSIKSTPSNTTYSKKGCLGCWRPVRNSLDAIPQP